MKAIMPKLRCADGVQLSVQASEAHYCLPFENKGPYTHVEVRFVTIPVPATWFAYAEDKENPAMSDVYGYVPIELVQEFIANHGGIDLNCLL